MNILNRFTLENLKQNKKRTIVTIIGVALSTALICAVAGMVMSFQKTLINMVQQEVGDYHVRYEDVPSTQLKYIENNINISKDSLAYSQNLGYAKLEGSQNEYKPYVYVRAMDKKALSNNGLKLTEGRMPENENEIVMTAHIESNGKVKINVGETITLNIGDRVLKDGTKLTQENPYRTIDEKTGEKIEETIENTKSKTYTIVGIVERPCNELEQYQSPGYTIITYLNDSDVKNSISEKKDDKYNIAGLFLKPKDYGKINKSILNTIKENTGMEINGELNSDLIRYQGGLSENAMNVIYSLAAIIIAIIIVSSIFVIRNSFSISVSEKNKQYGMMASVGATSKQIKKSVLFEGFLIGLVGIPLGIICGIIAVIILIGIVNYLLADMLNGMKFVYTIPLSVILLSIVIASITIYLSCIIPARRASKTSPIDAIRGSNDIKIKAKKVKTSKLTKKIFGIGGVIASKNLKRSKKKYRTTVISLVVSISIFIALSSFLEYGRTMTGIYYTKLNYDISAWGITEKECKEIANIDTITDYAYLKNTSSSLEVNIDKYGTEFGKSQYNSNKKSNSAETDQNQITDDRQESLYIIRYNNDYFKKFIKKLGLNENDYNKIAILEDDVIYYHSDKKKSIEHYYNINDGETIDAKLDDKDIKLRIAKISTERPMGMEQNYYDGGLIFISEDYDLGINDSDTVNMCISSSNPQKVEDELKKLKKENEEYSELSITNYDTYAKQSERMMLVISIFLYGFITVITLIGVTNIFNTITTNMILRSKEFAMLKSIGMTSKEFNKMIRLESLLYGFKALLIGIPIGILGSYGIYKSFAQDLDCGYLFPWIAILISIVFVFIIVGLTMKYSLNKINKQNIVETIRKDNI